MKIEFGNENEVSVSPSKLGKSAISDLPKDENEHQNQNEEEERETTGLRSNSQNTERGWFWGNTALMYIVLIYAVIACVSTSKQKQNERNEN